MSVRSVADLLGLSESNVKVQSMRALARLRSLLGEDSEAGSPSRRR